jgi:integrase
MSGTSRPTGHLQVKTDRSGGTRSYWALWRDEHGARGGRRLGPAHVRDSGRRTPRGAIIWRAGDGPRPTPEHLTPKDAQTRLDGILDDIAAEAAASAGPGELGTLFEATQGWVAERSRDKGLKRTTLAGYEILFERLYRDLGADTPVRDFADGRLRGYFEDFKSYKVVSEETALRARAEGKDVQQLEVERWTAQPAGSIPVEVTTKAEAVRLADELPGTWHHLRRGAYRVVPLDARRARTVTYQQSKVLRAEGWIVVRRKKRLWTLVGSAATSTRNEYRDVFAACLNYAVRQRWIAANPLAEVKRRSNRAARERVLRRDDFYDPDEVARLLSHAPDVFHEAFWLCGAHAGLRLPGEALGIRWGAVDFNTGILRPYDNWVRDQLDTTKTADSEAIPMTPRLDRALATIKQRGYATADADFVFIDQLDHSRPVSDYPLREAFHRTRRASGLKPLKMYNLRHSFGTSLASNGVDIRTIQALMRHKHLSTTEQYVAYSPRPELANQIARALDPRGPRESIVRSHEVSGGTAAAFLERLDEEIPAKWSREVRRLYAETSAEATNSLGAPEP